MGLPETTIFIVFVFKTVFCLKETCFCYRVVGCLERHNFVNRVLCKAMFLCCIFLIIWLNQQADTCSTMQYLEKNGGNIVRVTSKS